MKPRTACCFAATSLSLFDAGYVTITPKPNFEVSRRIKEEFENGRQYYELHGRRIAAPDDPRSVPDRAALTWHNQKVYLGLTPRRKGQTSTIE